MNKPITHTHNGTVVTYNENNNRWEFTLRGRDRSTESLTLAREAIDKPDPKKAKPFEKIAAWFMKYGDNIEKVEVTGIGEKSRYSSSSHEVWIKTSNGRNKQDVHYLKPSNEKNDSIIAQMLARRESIAKLEKEFEKLKSSLEPLKIQVEEEA